MVSTRRSLLAQIPLQMRFYSAMQNASRSTYRQCLMHHFSKKILPYQWLIARVVPILKSGNKHKIENYRPISIICTRKIFEHSIYKVYFITLKIAAFFPKSMAIVRSSQRLLSLKKQSMSLQNPLRNRTNRRSVP